MTTATTEETTAATAAAPAGPDKRALSLEAVLSGIKARNLGELHPKFTQVEDGAKITLVPDESNAVLWPSISIGRNGGITINELSSYPGDKTLETAVNGEVMLAKQTERRQKRADEAAKAAAAAEKKPVEGETAEQPAETVAA